MRNSLSLKAINSIYLRRKRKLVIFPNSNESNETYVIALLQNIKALGHTFSFELRRKVAQLPVDEIGDLYAQVVEDLKVMVGAHVPYVPMYPNFPDQVKNASSLELSANAAMHYLGDWFGRRIMPDYAKIYRKELMDKTGIKEIELGTMVELDEIFTGLIKSKSSISETDKMDIELFIYAYGDEVIDLIPSEIQMKENRALLCSGLLKHTTIADAFLQRLIKTATDVLRLTVAMSGGDVSLAENTKFRNFSKKERRLLLGLLENCKNITEDMLRYPNRWKRLGERLHPFEYRSKFPSCCDAFDIIRNDKPFQTFNGKVEASLLEGDITQTALLLKSRPGEYARRLDNMLRIAEDKAVVVNTFNEIASNISNPVLLQISAHFKHRNAQKELRTFFPKGNVGRATTIANNLPVIDETICASVISACQIALVGKYNVLKPLGKVYLDSRLKDYTVPFALRSASKALKTISRGSKLDLPHGNTIRFFIWWKDGKSRTDIDLSAVALDEDHQYKFEIAYYNLRELGGYHSGDITSAPDGASEFIDIDITLFMKAQIRYVVMCVNSYTSQPFYHLPECFAGFMVREFANSGEIYEPRTVENKFDLTSNTRICLPLILDLYERKVFWTDIALKMNPVESNNVYNNMSAITIMAKSMTSLVKPNLYDLFELHAIARGTLTSNISEANTIFAVDKGITPLDTEIILSEFL